MILRTGDGKVIVGYDKRRIERGRVYILEGKRANCLMLNDDGRPYYSMEPILGGKIVNDPDNAIEILSRFYFKHAFHMEVFCVDILGFIDHTFVI